MVLAVATRTEQLALLTAYKGPAASYATRIPQSVMMVALGPPEAKFAVVSQAALLLARSAGAEQMTTRTSQLVEMVAYQTGVPDPARSRAWAFNLDGHEFYVLNLGAQGTFLWDEVTKQWCQFDTAGYGQWNMLNGCMWGDRIIGGDILSDQLWELDPTAVLDQGWRDIIHVATGGLVTRSRINITCDSFRIASSAGFLDDVNGTTMTLNFSDDGGRNWSPDFTIALTEDDFTQEIAWSSLGAFDAPGRVFQITDVGGIIRIDGADAMLNGFDNDQQSQDAQPEEQ